MNFRLVLSNYFGENTLRFEYGSDGQWFYFDQFNDGYYFADSMQIGGAIYYDVLLFNFSRPQSSKYLPGSKRVDSVLYNYEFGILKTRLFSGKSLVRAP
jgi:hypothetical protein